MPESAAVKYVWNDMYYAIAKDDIARIKQILEAQPELATAQNEFQQTPLHCAVCQGKVGITRILVESFNADILVPASNGDTPLHWVIFQGKALDSTPQLILEYAEARDIRQQVLDARNVLGETPLLTAAINGLEKQVVWLLQQGASPFIKDNKGKKPIDVPFVRTICEQLGIKAGHEETSA